MNSETTHNEFIVYNEWSNSNELGSMSLIFDDDQDQIAYEDDTDFDIDSDLIPADDSGELASRMGLLLFAVSAITITMMWFLLGGFNSPSTQTRIAQINHNQPYPTPTLIGPGLRAGSGALARDTESNADIPPTIFPTLTPVPLIQAEATPLPSHGFNPDSSIVHPYVTDKMYTNLDSIINTDFPARDYLATHVKLTDLALPQQNSPVAWQLGQRRSINVVGDQVEVRLAAAGSHAYIWVDSRLSIPDNQFDPIVSRIDGELYPAITSLFGQERRPGIDSDARFHIFHLASLESRELGYFDSSDAYPKEVFAESNEHEAIYINMDSITLGGDVYYGTLVHELQHLVQWNIDRNESTWLDEGMSQLSEVYTGFNSFSVDDYTSHNGIQLNDWSYDNEKLYSHYGGSALFVVYLWEQFGDDFIRTLSANRLDGMSAVISTLNQSPERQPFKTVFRNWLIAVYLNDENQAESQFGFSRYEFEAPIAHQVAWANSTTPFSAVQHRPQFSGWYVELPSNQQVTLSFAGDSVQPLFSPLPPNIDGTSGTAFFAPPRNRVDATLRKSINLSGTVDPQISFDVWYDMEEGYDYVYLMISADSGRNWEMVLAPNMKQGTYGPGFSGTSAGWRSQSVSLSQWSGQQIIVQFQVLTDSAVPGNGFAIDNILISGEQAASTFEFDGGGWVSQGFVRTGSFIPQEWIMSLVQQLPNGQVDVRDINIDRYGEFQGTIQVGENASLIIAPASPFTTHKADFWLSIE
ncbi:MAG: hypothetical protein AB8G95_04880 [Anaerolineae bacterium]